MSAGFEGTELSDLERALRALPPRPATLDRDAVLYRSGWAAGARRWRRGTAAATLAAALAVALLVRPGGEPGGHAPVPPSVPAEEREAVGDPPVPSPASNLLLYHQLQEQVLTGGFDALPQAAPAPRSPATPADEELLRGL